VCSCFEIDELNSEGRRPRYDFADEELAGVDGDEECCGVCGEAEKGEEDVDEDELGGCLLACIPLRVGIAM